MSLRARLLAAAVAGALIGVAGPFAGCLTPGDEPIYPLEDGDPLVLSASSPADGATGVDPAEPIRFLFVEEVLDGSAEVELVEEASGAAVGFSVAYLGKTLRLDPATPLAEETAYRASVATAQDLKGNPLAVAPLVLHFTTGIAGAGGSGGAGFAEVQDLFSASCALATCHVTAGGTAPMSLEPGQAYASIVGVETTTGFCGDPATTDLQRVAPGDLSRSCLFQLVSVVVPAAGRPVMPFDDGRDPKLPALDAAEVELIRRWILAGAPGP